MYLALGAFIYDDGSFTVFFQDTATSGVYPTFIWSPKEGARIKNCCGACGITHKPTLPVLVEPFDLESQIQNEIFSFNGETAEIENHMFKKDRGFLMLR